MIRVEKFIAEDIPQLPDWLKGTDRRFLVQYSGEYYSYPLTKEQMLDEIEKAGAGNDQLIFRRFVRKERETNPYQTDLVRSYNIIR